jgi:hypothetical protein
MRQSMFFVRILSAAMKLREWDMRGRNGRVIASVSALLLVRMIPALGIE